MRADRASGWWQPRSGWFFPQPAASPAECPPRQARRAVGGQPRRKPVDPRRGALGKVGIVPCGQFQRHKVPDTPEGGTSSRSLFQFFQQPLLRQASTNERSRLERDWHAVANQGRGSAARRPSARPAVTESARIASPGITGRKGPGSPPSSTGSAIDDDRIFVY